jgi:hypothetical protein
MTTAKPGCVKTHFILPVSITSAGVGVHYTGFAKQRLYAETKVTATARILVIIVVTIMVLGKSTD